MSQLVSPKILQDPISPRLGYQLRRASSAMMADLGNALSEIGLRPVEGTILILVSANPGCIQIDLSRVLGIKRTNMVPLISGLAQKGYIEKSQMDGRSLALTLTPAGEMARAEVNAIMDTHEAKFEQLLGGQNQAALRAALMAIAASGETDRET